MQVRPADRGCFFYCADLCPSCTALAALFPCSVSTLLAWGAHTAQQHKAGNGRGSLPGNAAPLAQTEDPSCSGAAAQQPSTTSPLNLSCSCLNSEISFTLSLALLTCVAFGVIREKILCPFTITGFWNIKMSLCIGSVILIGILTFD